ncbi:MAG: hypothetical protein CVU46_06345 [Chloroflexi bacterium HGW-Chloroflexi-8]|nr:MAG: hypothetical protein CVU46_06345 [Chloroflexi bacterium HGW-Chloroflexi-8]
MKRKFGSIIYLFVAIFFCFSLLGGINSTVKAATCTWQGSLNTDWFDPINWTGCGGIVPGEADDVVIPDVSNDPVIPRNFEVSAPNVKSITIESGAQLTIMGGMATKAGQWDNYGILIASMSSDYSIIYLQGTGLGSDQGIFTNHPGGIITASGVGGNQNDLIIYPILNNAGTVNLQSASLTLNKGGSHNGAFLGNAGTYLYIGADALNQTHNFLSDSSIEVPNFFVRGGTTNIEGRFWPPATGSVLFVTPSSEHCTLNFKTGANIVNLTNQIYINNLGKLILEPQTSNYSTSILNLYDGGELSNLDELSIYTTFDWRGGTISGNGTTNVLSGTTFNIRLSAHTIDSQTLVNSAIANWTAGNISLSNAATFQNDNIFNANATTTMNGGTNGSFINNGILNKNTSATTTTMNIGFTNNGEINVIAGTLTFPSGMTSGSGTIVDLGGGTLGSGDTLFLESGASLIGSGTLNGNLNNGGEVSPGNSPGLITVNGDYTQATSGILTIELAGTTPATTYDQLAITGNAILDGTLDVSILAPFVPAAGNSFTILTYASRTGTFGTLDLPALPSGLEWETSYETNAIILTVRSDDKYLYLPLVIR